VALVEVGDEPGVRGVPSEPPAGQGAGGRAVDRREKREQAEMAIRLPGGEGGHRHVQVTADNLGDVPERHALVADRV
jgi:hypothetical protein